MQIESLEGLTRVLQASISPVALVSGVGLLVLSQTNRFSRVTDRLRELSEAATKDPEKHPHILRQIVIFRQRAYLLRMAIGAALTCALFASVMILLIFAIAVLDAQLQMAVLSVFALSLFSLIISLVLFLCDMHLSLKAIEELLKDAETEIPPSTPP